MTALLEALSERETRDCGRRLEKAGVIVKETSALVQSVCEVYGEVGYGA
jgi:hypothetical protein